MMMMMMITSLWPNVTCCAPSAEAWGSARCWSLNSCATWSSAMCSWSAGSSSTWSRSVLYHCGCSISSWRAGSTSDWATVSAVVSWRSRRSVQMSVHEDLTVLNGPQRWWLLWSGGLGLNARFTQNRRATSFMERRTPSWFLTTGLRWISCAGGPSVRGSEFLG